MHIQGRYITLGDFVYANLNSASRCSPQVASSRIVHICYVMFCYFPWNTFSCECYIFNFIYFVVIPNLSSSNVEYVICNGQRFLKGGLASSYEKFLMVISLIRLIAKTSFKGLMIIDQDFIVHIDFSMQIHLSIISGSDRQSIQYLRRVVLPVYKQF